MNNKVRDLWEKMESGKRVGLVKHLYSSDISTNIYCTFQYPECRYGIALSFPDDFHINIQPFDQLSELEVSIYPDDSFANSNLLIVQIKNIIDKDIFACLCENLISNISDQDNIKDAITIFCNTLIRWKKLFDQKYEQSLSLIEQQGLYGELNFLQKCLKSKLLSNLEILQFYVGVDKSLRDFQGKNWAVEVKTTSTNNPQVLTINGERQLDDTMIDVMYLYHCSVEISKSNGETLVDKVESIKNMLHDDISSLLLFKLKLFEAGYNENHVNLYKSRCYKLRSEKIYHVTDTFPRIKENDLLPGVGNVQYGIVIANCEPYVVNESDVLSNCLNHD